MDLNKPYRVKTIDPKLKTFVGYLREETPRGSLVFRSGLNDVFLLPKSDIIKAEPLNPQDIETRKNGRYFTF